MGSQGLGLGQGQVLAGLNPGPASVGPRARCHPACSSLDIMETPGDPLPKPERPSGEEDRQASPDTRGLVHIIPGVGSLQAGVLGSHTLGCGFYRLGN